MPLRSLKGPNARIASEEECKYNLFSHVLVFLFCDGHVRFFSIDIESCVFYFGMPEGSHFPPFWFPFGVWSALRAALGARRSFGSDSWRFRFLSPLFFDVSLNVLLAFSVFFLRILWFRGPELVPSGLGRDFLQLPNINASGAPIWGRFRPKILVKEQVL